MAARDDKMYGMLVVHLEALYRHYLSGGTEPLKNAKAVLPEVHEDQVRIKAIIDQKFTIAECPSTAALASHARDLINRQILIRWSKPWYRATILGAAASDSQLMKFGNETVPPTHRVRFATDQKEGEAYLTDKSYYVEGAVSSWGQWLLLDDMPLESDIHPSRVRNPENKRTAGRPAESKRHMPHAGPTSKTHAKRPRVPTQASSPGRRSEGSPVSSPSPARSLRRKGR